MPIRPKNKTITVTKSKPDSPIKRPKRIGSKLLGHVVQVQDLKINTDKTKNSITMFEAKFSPRDADDANGPKIAPCR